MTEEVDDVGVEDGDGEVGMKGEDVDPRADADENPCPADITDPDECRAQEGCRVVEVVPIDVSDGVCNELEEADPILLCGRNDLLFRNGYPPQEWVYWREVDDPIEYVRVLKGGQFNGWTFCGEQSTDPLVKLDPPPSHDGAELVGCNPEVCFMGPIW